MATHDLSLVDPLLSYELKSLRVSSWIRIVAFAATSIGTFAVSVNLPLYSWTIVLAQISASLFILMVGRSQRHPRRLGTAQAVADGVALSLVPLIWLQAMPDAGLTVLIKNDIEMFTIALAAINTITMRYHQPLIICGFSVVSSIMYFVWATSGDPLVFSDSWDDVTLNAAVSLSGFWFNTLFVVPCACVILAVLASRGRRLVSRSATLERTKTSLLRYFPAQVVDSLLMRQPQLGGERRQIAVLFADLRDFTQLTESITPEEVVKLLCSVHERMVDAIFAHHGTLDKFTGDGLMALFGALDDTSNPARDSVAAAQAMRSALVVLNDERIVKGAHPLRQGIGIHLGPAVVGNIGTEQRMEFTAIGDTVNTASRVEQACKQLGTDILVTRAVVDQLDGSTPVTSLGMVEIRGKKHPLELFTVPAIST